MQDISVKGAREHNLCDVDLTLPRGKLICFTGVSGSGKSSLAFDTLYAEGQRRYIESLSTYARQFVGQLPKPDVDHIAGLSPSISISQKAGGQNPRSTVGTITEIYDFLRLLFARVATGFCPQCGKKIAAQSRQQIIDRIETLPEGTGFLVLAPLVTQQKGEHRDQFTALLKQGYIRARVDGHLVRLTDELRLDRQMRHTIELVIDRLAQSGVSSRARLAEAVERGLLMGNGGLVIAPDEESSSENTSENTQPLAEEFRLSAHFACVECGINFDPPTPQLFSFNSPQGMCPQCAGLGEKHSFDLELLIPNPALSLEAGCIEPLGTFKEMGRWLRHIFRGVADVLESDLAAANSSFVRGSLLQTPWEQLPATIQHQLLWGTGRRRIAFHLKTGSHGIQGHRWSGIFEGIIPRLLQMVEETPRKRERATLERYMRMVPCGYCQGSRLNEQARSFKLQTADSNFVKNSSSAWLSLSELTQLAVTDLQRFFVELVFSETEQKIAEEALKEVRARLGFLIDVGLGYLSLQRTAPTLSGGEMQRIRLASQIGSGLVGVLYILDEPSIGLHQRDNDQLLNTLKKLRDLGNTVIVVEHDEDTMRAADWLVDFGPGPGVHGGHVVAQGNPLGLLDASDSDFQKNSLTLKFLAGSEKIAVPSERRAGNGKKLIIEAAAHNNLKNIDIAIPLGSFVCVTGVSGSGKSSLVSDILVEALNRDLNRGDGVPGKHRAIHGTEHLDKMIAIDQSPIGRTPRSNPATYIKVFDMIRKLFAELPEAKMKGYASGRFSFNVSGGRCESCEGSGTKKLQMDFLAEVWITCPQCQGRRFNHETLSVAFKGKSIDQVLNMSIEDALKHFENQPRILHYLQTLSDVGLGYMKLGQPSPTLSGGEAQRIKLARELVKRSTGKTLYLLDEPTTGLHFADVRMLLRVLHSFVEAGNTVLVVEHNLDVLKTADWLIDLGPEGGEAGGKLVAEGTPEDVAAVAESHTGRVLTRVLNPVAARKKLAAASKKKRAKNSAKNTSQTSAPLRETINIVRAEEHNLKSVSVELPRQAMTVFCGPSGSGKTSLAMDTIYAEGQRRYIESLSSYARQFIGKLQKPKVQQIEGLSPSIAIEQKSASHSPRSTVGTVTEVYDYLRVLFARLGTPFCPDCQCAIGTQTLDEIIAKILTLNHGVRLLIAAPLPLEVGENYTDLWQRLRGKGFVRVRVDHKVYNLEEAPEIDRKRKHLVEVVVDRLILSDGGVRARLAESVETALNFGNGTVHVIVVDDKIAQEKWETQIHNRHLACDQCGRSFEPLAPHHFSFNSPLGWCPQCEGLGVQRGASPTTTLHHPRRTLAEGAIEIFPDYLSPLFGKMLVAFSQQTGIPANIPFDELESAHRRLLFHGTGDQWFDCGGFAFQFKGLYPAIEEAGRLSPSLRGRLEYHVNEVECHSCWGSRLRDDASAVRLLGKTIDQIGRMPLASLLDILSQWKLSNEERQIAGDLVEEVKNRLQFMIDVGLEYLTVSRPAPTLSGGESQRIRLAAQIGSGLVGVLYVLDEPTIGLHPRDNARLVRALHKLRDLGNTLLVVEHDREVIAGADNVLDFGPEAGKFGGEIVAHSAPDRLSTQPRSVTGPYITGKKSIPIPSNRRTAEKRFLTIHGARHNNLKSIDAAIPLGTLTAITGVSGSGKSSLINDILYKSLAKNLHRAQVVPGMHDSLSGVSEINKVIRVDQQPLGQTPSSNPATYTGVFDLIRDLFAQLPEARARNFSARRFSFNVHGGRCERCEGNGQIKIEMHFLPDVWVTCEDCGGKRYERETLQVRYKDFSIADVLEMSCAEALTLFRNVPNIRRTLQLLVDVGLGYLSLGQPAPTLSGGEAQRVKLAAELARPDTGRTLYLLDEPTTGLHFEDLKKLLQVLHRLVDLGNTVVVIEHNLEVIKSADWVIDLGPEAGLTGGHIVFAGPPEALAAQVKDSSKKKSAKKVSKKIPKKTAKKVSEEETSAESPVTERPAEFLSHTARALAPVLQNGVYEKRAVFDPVQDKATREEEAALAAELQIEAVPPWTKDGPRWHLHDRVARNGHPCHWDSKILRRIIDTCAESPHFAPPNWNHQHLVSVGAAHNPSLIFLQINTGDEWLLHLKFQVATQTFLLNDLVDKLNLRPLNEIPEIPLYGSQPRVRLYEHDTHDVIELRVHSWREIDTAAFWLFISTAEVKFLPLVKRDLQ